MPANATKQLLWFSAGVAGLGMIFNFVMLNRQPTESNMLTTGRASLLSISKNDMQELWNDYRRRQQASPSSSPNGDADVSSSADGVSRNKAMNDDACANRATGNNAGVTDSNATSQPSSAAVDQPRWAQHADAFTARAVGDRILSRRLAELSIEPSTVIASYRAEQSTETIFERMRTDSED
eukprot:SAG31_NODE_1676_length_7551_cov_1.951691_1_plen_180_part_10